MMFSTLDLKLAFRMLLRYPGLTAMAVVSMAFAIMVGAGTFEVVKQVLHPTIPLPEGDRIVGIQYLNAETQRVERRVLYDLRIWRERLESIQELGAVRVLERNLATAQGPVGMVLVSELDAAALALARTPALLGRLFTVDDERPGAPPVVMLTYGLWRDRFGADPGVIGTTVRLGEAVATVVGVMPEGFAYPTSPDLWAPLRVTDPIVGAGDGPAVIVVGRLAPGVPLERAREEVEALTAGIAADFPQRHERLTVHVRPFALIMFPIPAFDAASMVALLFVGSNLPVIFFLALVCGNVALLMFARAATRESELVVRNALGASRGRILGQLFGEALVLAAVAAAIGLAATSFGLRWSLQMLEQELFNRYPMPFWYRTSLSPSTILYVVGLTTLGAVIAGVIPGLKVTRSIAAGLKYASAGGGGFRFGGIWTGVIIAQIAVMVVFPFVTAIGALEMRDIQPPTLGSPSEDYFIAKLALDGDPRPGLMADVYQADRAARFGAALEELETRLAAEPRVAGVTYSFPGPGAYHPSREVEVDGPSAPPMYEDRGHRAGVASVDLNYFEVLGLPVVAGRAFQPTDLEPGPRVVIVNESFVSVVLGGRNAIGTRIRYVELENSQGPTTGAEPGPDDEPGPWLEIVGVVPDIGKMSGFGFTGIFHPSVRGDQNLTAATIHVPGGAGTFGGTLLAAAAAVGPELVVRDPMPLDRITEGELDFYLWWGWVLLVTGGIAVLLSLGGIYAITSCTVSQRTREIGIRVALGSGRGRILGAVFLRPLIQVALGIAVGGMLLFFLITEAFTELNLRNLAVFAAYLVFVAIVCALACTVPTRRALAIQPAEALRVE